jgi:hypothetical protein
MFAMGAKSKMPKGPDAAASVAATAPLTPASAAPTSRPALPAPAAPGTPEPTTPRAGAGGDKAPTPPATPGGEPPKRAAGAAPGADDAGAAPPPAGKKDAKAAKKAAKKTAAATGGGGGGGAPEHQPMQLLLDVSLDAPIVVLPLNSHSPDHLEIDLGTLLVKNRIVWERRGALGGVSGSAAPAGAPALGDGCLRHQKVLMDDMTVQLLNLSGWVISGGRRGDNFIRHMGDGITVDVRRTLLALPGPPPPMAVAVRMKVLVASLLDTEYHKILGILSGNFGETPNLPPELFALHTRRLAEQRAAAAAAAVAAGGAAAVAAARAAKEAPASGGGGGGGAEAKAKKPKAPRPKTAIAEGGEPGAAAEAAGEPGAGGEPAAAAEGGAPPADAPEQRPAEEEPQGEDDEDDGGVHFEEELTAPLPTARRRRRRLERADPISADLRVAPAFAGASPPKGGRRESGSPRKAAAAAPAAAAEDSSSSDDAEAAYPGALAALGEESFGTAAGMLEHLRRAVTNFSLANASLLTMLDDAVSMTCSVAIGSAQLLLWTEQPDGQQAFPLGSVEFGNFWLSWSGTARANMMLSVAMPTVCARDLRPGVPKETSLVLSTAEIGGGAGGAAAAASAALAAPGGGAGAGTDALAASAAAAAAAAPALSSGGDLLPSLLRLEMRSVSSIEGAGNVSGIQLRLQRPTLVLDIGFIMQVGVDCVFAGTGAVLPRPAAVPLGVLNRVGGPDTRPSYPPLAPTYRPSPPARCSTSWCPPSAPPAPCRAPSRRASCTSAPRPTSPGTICGCHRSTGSSPTRPAWSTSPTTAPATCSRCRGRCRRRSACPSSSWAAARR